jgi:hypothetical protein
MLRVPVAPKVAIESVGAPGDIELENVMIVQEGGGVVSLEGWQLDNGNGAVFTFPELALATAGARVSVYTRSGANSVDKLYWGLAAPAWGPGSVATLRDTQGAERATFTVP